MLKSISVVIPTRNEAAAIRSFLASLPDEIELIVIDASDDATPELIETLRPARTHVIRSPAHIAQARQIGAETATGEWLLFSDADVRFAPDYFERLDARLIGDAFYGVKRATASHPIYTRCFLSGQRFCHSLGIPAASGSNMVVRRSVLFEAGGFRPDLPVNEDSELFLRLAHLGYQVAYAPELQVFSLDDRRLDRRATRKLLHSALRCLTIAAAFYLPLPQRLLQHDWGYWRSTRPTLHRR